jgi:ADP-ribose pyrophosphatase YjhB (NUDIX family)
MGTTKLGVRQPLIFNNINALIVWLNHHNIDTSLWGEGNAKSVINLWEEISSGEIIILENPPRRIVQVVQVVIRRGRQVLLEAEQIMENGNHRFRNQPPSEKFKPGESYLDAASRCLQEELGVSSEAIHFRPESYYVRTGLLDSYSYPGLLTEYTFHMVEADVTELPEEPFWRGNEAALTGDPVKRHRWEWRYDRSFVCS